MPLFGVVKRLAEPIFGIVDKLVKDKDAAAEMKHEIENKLAERMELELESKRDIIVAEAQSEHWITSAWRPITMLSFVFILMNNYVLVPYAIAFGAELPSVEIPPDMYTLLTIGIGGYVASRGGEKMLKTYKEAKENTLK